ncbi:MAG: patatin-like phospholipase family protein [Myxococcota bacterium]|nr:patatin-like phospholipase family protein [Myxococcota bacterium]
MTSDGKYALVLGGGGANCSYQLGVWKALREKNIEINAVIGTSGGAINGAFIAQGDWDLAWEVWENLTLDKIVDIPKELFKNGRFKFSFKTLSKATEMSLLKNKGLDTTPFRQLLKKYVKESRIRRSGLDFGLVTYQINELKPLEIFIEDIDEGMLGDYILASASFPIFKRTEIGNKWFIDGGIYNNVPFSTAKERGYRNIIVVDVSRLGRVKEPDVSGTQTIYIKNSKSLGGVLNMNPANVGPFSTLGYLDTLKAFGDVSGMDYFLDADVKTVSVLDDILRSAALEKKFSKKFETENGPARSFAQAVRGILPKEKRTHWNIILVLAESAASSLNIENRKIWRFDDLIAVIWKKYSDIEAIETVFSEGHFRKFFSMLMKQTQKSLNKTERGLSPMMYDRAMTLMFGKSLNSIHIRAIEKYFPDLLPAKIFLSVLATYYGLPQQKG